MAQQNKNEQQVDVNQLLKVRREKLADLQERGKDPFQITKYETILQRLRITLKSLNVNMMKKESLLKILQSLFQLQVVLCLSV